MLLNYYLVALNFICEFSLCHHVNCSHLVSKPFSESLCNRAPSHISLTYKSKKSQDQPQIQPVPPNGHTLGIGEKMACHTETDLEIWWLDSWRKYPCRGGREAGERQASRQEEAIRIVKSISLIVHPYLFWLIY